MLTKILELLTHLKAQTGLDLKPCPKLPGPYFHKGTQYYNVELNQPVWLSTEWSVLERHAKQYGTIKVEPNGYKRIAIYFNND